jgi:hypothetical protein
MNGIFLQGDEQRIPKEIVPSPIGSNGVFPVDEMHNQYSAAAHNILYIFGNVVITKSPHLTCMSRALEILECVIELKRIELLKSPKSWNFIDKHVSWFSCSSVSGIRLQCSSVSRIRLQTQTAPLDHSFVVNLIKR